MALTQLVIDVGAAPNDGEGDPIRTAFIKTNDNFTELYSIPNSTPPTTPKGKFGDQPGMYAYSSGYFYYCYGIYDNINAIWGTVVSDANVSSTKIQNGNSNVSIPTVNGNVIISVNGNANSAVFSEGKLAVEGGITSNSLYSTANVSAGGYLLGDGGLISNIATNYSNANVAAYLPTYTGNVSAGNISSGNISATNINVANAIIATTFIGNVQGNITGNLVVPGSNTWVLYNNGGNAGSDIGFTYDAATKNVTVGNTVTANFFVGDGSSLSNLPTQPGTYTNSNVAAYLPTYTGNMVALTGDVTTTANIQGNYILGNGAFLTGISAGSSYGNSNVAAYLPTYSGNIANLEVTGTLTAVTAANGTNTTEVATTAFVQNAVTAAGGYGNTEVAAYLPTYTGNLVSLTGPVTTTANVTGANLRTGGLISAFGNVTGSNFLTNGGVYVNTSVGGQAEITLSDGVGSGYIVEVGTSAATWAGAGSLNLVTSSSPGANIGMFVAQSERGRFTTTGLSVTGVVSATGNVSGPTVNTSNVVSSGNLNLSSSGGNATQVTGGGTFRLPSFTNIELANITGVPGDLIYNSDLNKVQAWQYNASNAFTWVSLSVSTYQ